MNTKQLQSINWNLVITVLFFGALGFYFVKNQEELNQLLAVPPLAVVAIALLKITGMFVNGFFTKFIMGAFDKKISIKETTFLAWLTSVGNFFGPILGGASIRAVYLKKKFDFEYSKFLSTLYGLYIVNFSVSALFGIVCSLLLANRGSLSNYLLPLIVFLVILFVNLSLMVLPLTWITLVSSKIKWMPKRLQNILDLIVEGWEVIRKEKRLLLNLTILNFITLFIAIAQTYVLYSLFVDSFSVLSVILYTVLGSLTLLVSITPGAIGIREALLLFFASSIALDSSQILQIAAVDRSISFLILLVSFVSIKLSKVDKKIGSF